VDSSGITGALAGSASAEIEAIELSRLV